MINLLGDRGLRYNGKANDPGAQPERRGEARPGRDLLGARPPRPLCITHQIPSIGLPDNDPNSQALSSLAACPAAIHTASVAGRCDADTLSEAGSTVLALARGTAGRASVSGGPALGAAETS